MTKFEKHIPRFVKGDYRCPPRCEGFNAGTYIQGTYHRGVYQDANSFQPFHYIDNPNVMFQRWGVKR